MATFVSFLCIMFGGALGAVCRYFTQEIVIRWTKLPGWMSIFIINILGSFLIGLATATLLQKTTNPQQLGHLSLELHTRSLPEGLAILAVGFCGAYTTFSSFSLDNYFLLHGKYGQLAVNMLGSLVGAFLAVWAGWSLAQMVFA
jgi:CrcB protein